MCVRGTLKRQRQQTTAIYQLQNGSQLQSWRRKMQSNVGNWNKTSRTCRRAAVEGQVRAAYVQ